MLTLHPSLSIHTCINPVDLEGLNPCCLLPLLAFALFLTPLPQCCLSSEERDLMETFYLKWKIQHFKRRKSSIHLHAILRMHLFLSRRHDHFKACGDSFLLLIHFIFYFLKIAYFLMQYIPAIIIVPFPTPSILLHYSLFPTSTLLPFFYSFFPDWPYF